MEDRDLKKHVETALKHLKAVAAILQGTERKEARRKGETWQDYCKRVF